LFASGSTWRCYRKKRWWRNEAEDRRIKMNSNLMCSTVNLPHITHNAKWFVGVPHRTTVW
jgi:hypothetical protein